VSGQYDVRWTRGSTVWAPKTNSDTRYDSAQLATLRSVRYTNPSNTGTLKLALKIKATDQLNGVINQLSVFGQQNIRVWAGGDADTGGWLPPSEDFKPSCV
jgi:hypothetical protein